MREIRALIIDDEPVATEALRVLLQRHADVHVIGECRDGIEAVRQIGQLAPDVVFLDVQMPELDGFDIIRELGSSLPCMLVFVTAHEEHALRAFDVQPVDYLLKPVAEERMDRAIQRIRRRLGDSRALDPAKQLAARLTDTENGAVEGSSTMVRAAATRGAERSSPRSYLSQLTVRTGKRSTLVSVNEIDWIAADDYCVNVIIKGRRHLVRASLASLETRLDPATFVRIHRSALVNITRVVEWQRKPLRRLVLVLVDRTHLPVSRSKRAKLLAMLNSNAM